MGTHIEDYEVLLYRLEAEAQHRREPLHGVAAEVVDAIRVQLRGARLGPWVGASLTSARALIGVRGGLRSSLVTACIWLCEDALDRLAGWRRVVPARGVARPPADVVDLSAHRRRPQARAAGRQGL